MAAKTLEEAAQEALADMQDWNELEALRESLREHMAEIHRLREAVRQALAALEKEASSLPDWLTMMQAARTALRAALAEDALQRLTDVQQEMEPVTDCHKKGRDKLPPPPDHIADTNKMVEPVAYMSMCFSNGQTKPHSKTLFWSEQYTGRTEPVDAGAWGEERVVPLFAVTPKRQPLTDEQIEFRFGRKPTKYMMFLIRSTERAHGIGGEE